MTTWTNRPTAPSVLDDVSAKTNVAKTPVAVEDNGSSQAGSAAAGNPSGLNLEAVRDRIDRLDPLVSEFLDEMNVKIELRPTAWYEWFRINFNIVPTTDANGNKSFAFQVSPSLSEYQDFPPRHEQDAKLAGIH